MPRIGGKEIDASIYDILIQLRVSLLELGINKLADIRKSGTSNVIISCPIHKNGQERNPSCGVSTTISKDIPAGTVHCLACGYSANFETFISNCFGYEDGGTYGLRWLFERFEVSDSISIDLPFNRPNIPKQIVSEIELDTYRYYNDYMWKRKLTPEIVEAFDIGYDVKTRSITFPVRDLDGDCIFIARRSVSGKRYLYPEDVEKPVYGLDRVVKEGIKDVVVCESFFNALYLWTISIPAVALLGTGSEIQYGIMNRVPVYRWVLALDGDLAGKRGEEAFAKHVRNGIIYKMDIPTGKDVNDLEIPELLDIYDKKHLYKCR